MTAYTQLSPASDPDAPHMRRIMFADQGMREDGVDPRNVARLLRRYADLIERAEIKGDMQ